MGDDMPHTSGRRTVGETSLREAIRRYRVAQVQKRMVDGVSLAPACAWGMVLQDRLHNMAADLEDIRAELQWIRRIILASAT